VSKFVEPPSLPAETEEETEDADTEIADIYENDISELWADEPEEPDIVSEEVKLNLDTLCLIPDEGRLYLVWRGLCPIDDLTAIEIATVEISEV
jgi:hypothetical protein